MRLSSPVFNASMALLQKLFGHTLEKTVIDTYWTILEPLDETVFKMAVTNVVRSFRSTSACPFPPPADFLAACGQSDDHIAQNAVTLVREAIARVGAYHSVDFGDTALHTVIERWGGWTEICQWSEKDWQLNLRNFIESYKVTKNTGIKGPKQLDGWFNRTNTRDGYLNYIYPARKIQIDEGGHISIEAHKKLPAPVCPECEADLDDKGKCVAQCSRYQVLGMEEGT